MSSVSRSSTASERLVLAALASGGFGRTPGELSDETGLLPLAVRACLRELARRGMVCAPAAGRWRLDPDQEWRP
jgi:DNA-binding IclR family transcriptional regulator